MKMIKTKRIFTAMYLLAGVLLLLACSGQIGREGSGIPAPASLGQDPNALPLIIFDTLDHDFGTIIEGEMVVCYFEYVNGGQSDLILKSVEASCGCTSPDWSREPLRPGGKAYLKIVFDATGRSGAQRKIVTVSSNASNSVVYLTLKANINNSV